MIEASCTACGALNRASEADVPVGAKFLTCAACKARVAIPSKTSLGVSQQIPKPPPIPVPKPAKQSDVIELADLPAPRKSNPLGGTVPAPKPAPKSPLAGADPMVKSSGRSSLAAALDPELPAPKPQRPVPNPMGERKTIDLDILGTDLELATPSVPSSSRTDDRGTDLPAPKVPRNPDGKLPTGEIPRQAAIADLPAPKPKDMPRTATTRFDAPAKAPSPSQLAGDLPSPRKGPSIPDLPAPKPRAGSPGLFDDLPAPSQATGTNLPAPQGFFDDLPQPAESFEARPDLPAPKGFFDDLPQPAPDGARADLPAPKGFFDDLPQVKSNPSSQAGSTDVPAPKGFFDDLPGRPNRQTAEPPAPKGFFDDLPGRPNQQKPEPPAPKGFFENLPARPNQQKPEPPAPKGFFDDLPQRGKRPSDALELAPMPSTKRQSHELELGEPVPAAGYDDLDLSMPSTPPPPRAAARASAANVEVGFGALNAGKAGEMSLELEVDPRRAKAPSRPPPEVVPGVTFSARSGPAEAVMAEPPVRASAPHLELEHSAKPVARPTPKPKRASEAAAEIGAQKRRSKVVLGALLGVAVLGAGGFVFWKRHTAQVERAETIQTQLDAAKKAFAAKDATRWQRAAAAARQVLEVDEENPEALGIAAESLLASALADGNGAAGKITQARHMIDVASKAGVSNPQLVRARALGALAAGDADAAVKQLQPMAKGAPKDGALALYLAWALEAKGDLDAAIASYSAAIDADASIKVIALYGRGRTALTAAHIEAARADFMAVLEVQKDHIGAQVGLAAAQPQEKAQQRESDLLAILQRKDIANADPRAVTQAWILAAEEARRAGRFDVARDRYRNALKVSPNDIGAMTGLAETELRDGKLAAAADLTSKILAGSKDTVAAQLVECEIEVKQKKLDLAGKRLTALAGRNPPLAPLEQARLLLITGMLREAEGKDDEAVDSYVAAAKAAGDLDLAPTMAAVAKLGALSKSALNAKDTKRANALRDRADQLFGSLAEKAEKDPQLAMAIGSAYLQTGDAVKAEPWLRKVVDLRESDADARYQLGRALLKLDRVEDAMGALKDAIKLDPQRADIGLELARAYETTHHDSDAAPLYDKLLAASDPSLELLSRAGRFFARTGSVDKAAKLGDKILATDPDNAAGSYLKGEGLLAAGKLIDAKHLFQHAVDGDPDPQYYDALGRSAESLSLSGDREMQDLAIRSYIKASDGDPALFSPLAGLGRLYIARHEAAKAIPKLIDASRIDPRNPEVMFLIGCGYQELQQNNTALQWLEASFKLKQTAEAAYRMGQLYRDSNQGAQAATAFGHATRLGGEIEKQTGQNLPWMTDALYWMGRVSLDLHNEAAARDAWEKFIARPNVKPGAQLNEVKQQLSTTLHR